MTAIQVLQTLSSNELEIISSICIDSLSSVKLSSDDGSIERFLTLNSAVGKIRAACELSTKEISATPSSTYLPVANFTIEVLPATVSGIVTTVDGTSPLADAEVTLTSDMYETKKIIYGTASYTYDATAKQITVSGVLAGTADGRSTERVSIVFNVNADKSPRSRSPSLQTAQR